MQDSGYVCVIGGANVDVEGRSHGPLRPHDSNIGSVRRAPGGVGRNIAENLARLAVPTRLITALGDDEAGRWLADQTAATGVDLGQVVWVDAASTATYLSILDETGEMAVAINDMALLDELGGDALDARADTIAAAAAVVLDCNLTPGAIAQALRLASDRPLFVDTVSLAKAERIRPHLAQVHTLKPNRDEAGLLAGRTCTTIEETHVAARALVDAGVGHVAVSVGSEGVVFAERGGSGLVQPVEVEVATVTGAGDAMMAGLVRAHVEGQTFEDAVRFATAAAALTMQSPRTVAEHMSVEGVRQLLCGSGERAR